MPAQPTKAAIYVESGKTWKLTSTDAIGQLHWSTNMSIRLSLAAMILAPILSSDTGVTASEPSLFHSPDGRIQVHLSIKEKLDPYPAEPGSIIRFPWDSRGLARFPFGLDFGDMPPIARDLAIKGQSQRSVRETWNPVYGKSNLVLDHYNELRLPLEETKEPGRRIEFIVRAYDDGVGFRYYLPSQPSLGSSLLTSERSEFHFSGNHTVWAARYDTFVSHQENERPHPPEQDHAGKHCRAAAHDRSRQIDLCCPDGGRPD
jgi:hypothetical protein